MKSPGFQQKLTLNKFVGFFLLIFYDRDPSQEHFPSVIADKEKRHFYSPTVDIMLAL